MIKRGKELELDDVDLRIIACFRRFPSKRDYHTTKIIRRSQGTISVHLNQLRQAGFVERAVQILRDPQFPHEYRVDLALKKAISPLKAHKHLQKLMSNGFSKSCFVVGVSECKGGCFDGKKRLVDGISLLVRLSSTETLSQLKQALTGLKLFKCVSISKHARL